MVKKQAIAVALIVATGLGAACHAPNAPVGTVDCLVTVSDDFNTSLISGLKLVISSGDGEPLSLSPTDVIPMSSAGLKFTAQAKDEDPTSPGLEYVILISENVFGSRRFTFQFRGSLGQRPLAIKATLLLQGNIQESATVTATVSGGPIVLGSAAGGSAHAEFQCRPGVSCTGTIAPPILVGTAPSSPANNNLPRVRGQAQSDVTVKLYTTPDCSAVPAAEGTGAELATDGIAVAVLDDTTTTFYATATDANGSVSPCSPTSATYREDSTPPSPPTFAARASSSATGTSRTPRISGQAEAGSVVMVFTNAGCDGTAAASGSAAAFRGDGIAVTVPANSVATISVRAVDAAGNASACVEALTYVADSATVAPNFSASIPASPANNNTPRLKGAAEAEATVRIHRDANCVGDAAATGTAEEFAGAGIMVRVEDDTATTFYAQATDALGNVSTCSAGLTYVEDSMPPVAPSGLSTSPASPANYNTPFIIGASPVATTIEVFDDACGGNVVASGSAAMFASTGLQIPFGVIADDTSMTFYARAKDAAGNASLCAAIAYVEDSFAPAVPTITTTLPASPANLIPPNRVFVAGSALDAEIVHLYTSPDCIMSVTSGPRAVFESTGLQYFAASDFTTTFYVKSYDGANWSACSPASLFVEDSTPPLAPTSLSVSPPSPANDNDPKVIGSAEPGSTVEVFGTANCTGERLARGTASEFASPGLSVHVADNSTTTFYVRAIDAAKNIGACSATGVVYIEDSRAPAAPTDLKMDPPPPASTNYPRVAGVAEPGTTVEIFVTAACSGAPLASGSAATFASPGITVYVADNSTTKFYARAVDAARNASPCSPAFAEYVEDSAAPDAPQVTAVWPGARANNNAPKVIGVAEAGSTVQIFGTADCTGGALAWGNATTFAWPGITVAVPDNSTTKFYARAIDVAGNVGACSTSGVLYVGVVYVEDSSPPNTPAITATVPASPANLASPNMIRVIGTAPNATVVYLYTNGACATAVASGTRGEFEGAGLALNVAADATTTLFARTYDGANMSDCSAVFNFVEDGTAPLAPTGLGIWPGPRANENAPRIIGSAEIGTMVEIFGQVGCAGAVRGTATAAAFASRGIAVAVLDNTTETFYARTTDAAGNVGDCSALGVTFVEDSAGPTVPTNLRFAPASANNNTPAMRGTAEPNSTVYIYGEAACAGAVRGFGPAADFEYGGIGVTVADNSVTYFYVRAVDQAGNVGPCSTPGQKYLEDSTPPTFAGAISATSVINTTDQIALAWLAGSDSVTATASLVYDICESTTRGGCTAAFDATYTSAPGATGYVVTGRAANTRTYYLVRTRDAAGNRDANAVVVSAKTGGGNATVQLASDGQGNSACALQGDGTIRCWGDNTYGQLGDGTHDVRKTPVVVRGITNAVKVAIGWYHACALLADGSAKCWGDNGYGQLGNGSYVPSETPVAVASGSGVRFVDISVTHGQYGLFTCAVRAGGGVACWGDNQYGQLGVNNPALQASNVPVAAVGVSNATEVSTGGAHACALIRDGTAKCWGYNGNGMVGNGSYASPVLVPATVVNSGNWKQIRLGGQHSCALSSNGSVSCWGSGYDGELGNGATYGSGVYYTHTPVAVIGLPGPAVRISAGQYNTCVLLANGAPLCWGHNVYGQIGNAPRSGNTLQLTPAAPTGITAALDVLAGMTAYALLPDGSVMGMGKNDKGAVGDGTTATRIVPVSVSGLVGVEAVKQIATGGDTSRAHTCSLFSSGKLDCWGDNAAGQLGGGAAADAASAVAVTPFASNVVAMAVGNDHSCAIVAGGAVKCWGGNADGQLGNGDAARASQAAPVVVAGLANAIALGLGRALSCALIGDGTVKCWGNNEFGGLGNGAAPADSVAPVAVSGIANAKAVAVGSEHACALIADGTVKCWGRNDSGQLGYVSTTQQSATTQQTTPVAVSGLATARAITAGSAHSCALLEDGTAKCWGDNAFGQLGDGTSGAGASKSTPTLVSGIAAGDATSIAAGALHTCAKLADGTAKCWGYNTYGQLGDATNVDKSTPTAVTALAGVIAIGMNSQALATCALLVDGTVACFGNNAKAQLGDATTTNRNRAVNALPYP